ncbi:MAG: TM2 domain-containing protein [Bacteroidales bacterium]|nr:TM2 domain-containing protein [Bacteroidales bacterium]
MKKFFLALVAMFAITAVASAANYTADDSAIDAAIENAIDVNAFNLGNTATAPLGAAYVAMGNNDVVSLLLTFFLGWTGIHRMYMGSTPWMWILYLLTGGGFGVVVLLDFVFELIGFVDGSGLGKFYDNPNILMWL